jgi:hypothetical protein
VIIISENNILPDFERKNLFEMAFEYLAHIKYIEQKQQFNLEMTIYLLSHSAQLQNEMELFGIKENLMNFARLTQYTDYNKMQEIFSLIPKIKQGIFNFLSKLKSDTKSEDNKIDSPNFEDYFSPTKKTLRKILVRKIFNFIIESPSIFESNSRTITPQKKNQVKDNDKYICQICCNEFSEEELEIDHIYPYSLGGSHEIYNLMSLCKSCNLKKSNRIDYFQSGEGNKKILMNIGDFVDNLEIIKDFGKWLKKKGRITKKSNK